MVICSKHYISLSTSDSQSAPCWKGQLFEILDTLIWQITFLSGYRPPTHVSRIWIHAFFMIEYFLLCCIVTFIQENHTSTSTTTV